MIEAAKYYNSQASGLALKFLKDFDKTIDEIIDNPKTWITLDEDIKRYQLSHFAFGVLYRIVYNKIRIISVMNLYRKPNY
ncbi:MAG: hypothetical protein U9O87_05490 [Verrucomicrobiota bacterium]|nr:hypothetical protein [Verrucomicrobiota bacterium]